MGERDVEAKAAREQRVERGRRGGGVGKTATEAGPTTSTVRHVSPSLRNPACLVINTNRYTTT